MSSETQQQAFVFPLSFAQQRLWFLDQYEGGSATYNMTVAMHLRGRIEVDVLERALNEIVSRHETLRTTFRTMDKQPVQVIHDECRITVPVEDFTRVPVQERMQDVCERIAAEARRPFDLTKGPLVRLKLFRLGEDDHALHVNIHHIIADGWSMDVFVRELITVYEALRVNATPQLPELAIQYVDFAQWQREWLQGEVLESKLTYWKDQLAGVPRRLDIPTDRPRPPFMTFRGKAKTFEIGQELRERLETVSLASRATLFMTLLSVFSALISHYTREDDVVIASPIANRNRPEIEPLIGFFVNTLPIRVQLKGNPTFKALLKQVEQTCLEAYKHQDMPFEKLVNELGLTRDLSRAPLAQVAFAHQNIRMPQVELPGLHISNLEVQTGTAKTDLVVMVEEGEQQRGLLAKVEYNSDLFDDQTVEDIIRGYIRLLERVAADPGQDLTTLLERAELCDLKGSPAAPQEDVAATYLNKSNLTENQLHLWLGQKLLGKNPLYNLKTVYTLHEPIDRDHFQSAFQKIVDNNENFRTVFYETDGIPYQRVLDQVTYAVPYLDFSGAENPQEAARQWIESQAGNVFDLTQVSFQSVLIKLADEKYQWYMSQHHILTDGWSLHLTYNQLTEYYRAALEGRLDGIRPLAQYSAYVKDERDFRQSNRYQKSKIFWEKLLADRPEAPSFYGVTPKRKSTAIERVSCPREGELIEKINALTENPPLAGIAEQTLKYNYFLSLYALFMSRVSGKNRIAIGVPIHNRRTKDHVDIQGLFMHIVPLVIEIDESQSMIDLMQQIKRKTFNAMKHGQFVVPNSPREPAYDILFNYQIWRLPHFYQKAFELEWLHSGHTFESCGLQVHDFEKEVRGNEKLTFEFEFKREVFAESTRGQAMEHFFNLMSATLANIDQPMCQLDMLSPVERRRQIVEYNDTVRPYPVDRCVHQLFEEQAQRTPDHIAVTCGDTRLTYAELNTRANQLAHRLIREGVASNQLVGICCRPNVDMLVGILGVLKSGAAYVPLDPAYPEDRLRTMLEAAHPTALVLHGRTWEMHDFTALCASTRCRVINLDAGGEDIVGSHENPGGTVTSDNLAYMIFTSGSTGIPKGAGVYHRGLTNLLAWFTQTFEFTDKDSVLLISSLSFDLTQKNLYAPLLVGGTLHLYDECYFDPKQITERVAAAKISWLNCTPSAFYPLLDHCQSSRFAALRSLRFVFLGGEPIAMTRLMPWLDTDGVASRVVNTYGPTECTDVTTYHVITDPAKVVHHSVPIGRPVANVQHYILDESLRLVPWGVPGELCIAGDCVGAGYIHDAALSAQKFIPNPFGEGKLYRTGDVVRRQPDGDIVFVGRGDEQVKVRGFRIELGEIAAALNKHPDVRDAVVITRDDGHGQKSLAAYVVGERTDVSAAVIQNDLKKDLPDYMVPGSVTLIDKIPLTPNGKTDRKALPEPADSETLSQQPYVPARNAVEEALVKIWVEVLGVTKIGIHDNFFDLGGHSLMATQIVAMANDAFAVDIPIRALFESPTVFGLGNVVNDTLATGGMSISEGITRISRDEGIPLSFGQQHLWVMENMTEHKATFNMPVALRVRGPLDRDRLQQVLDHIMDRHEVLRTTIRTEGDEFLQVIHPEAELPLETVPLDHIPENERLTYCRQYITKDAQRPFDLQTGPVIRAHLLQLDSADHVLMINVHHIAFDAFSANIILREIGTLYREFVEGQQSSLPPLSVQYADYAVWQRDQLQGEAYQNKLRRWQTRLKDASASLALPTDNPRPAVQTYNGAIARFQVEPEVVKDLENLSRASSATLYMTLLTAFSAVISQICRQQDIVLSSPIAGRSHREAASMIGLFVNLLPLRIDLSGNPSFQDLLERVRELCLEAQQDQDVTFDHILGTLNVAHDPGRSPFSQVIFNVQHAPADHFEVAGLQFSPLEYDHDTANTDLAVIMDQDASGGISAVVEYNTDLFKEETILRIIGSFENVLAAVRQDPQNQLSGIYETCGLDATLCYQSQKEKDPFGYYLQHSNLTGHQLILWAGQQLDVANPIYNSTITYRMPEHINIEHFRKAFQAVIDTRDSLRTVVQVVDGIPQRHVVDHLEYHVIYRDFSGETNPDQAAAAWIERQSKTAFQLDQCLFRSALLKVADNDFIWYMSQHHIITDGWSQVLTYTSVSQYYQESLAGDITLKPVPQYEEYVRHERDYRFSARSQKDKAYWDDILAQKEEALTFYGRQPVKETTAMCRLSHRLGEELTLNILRLVDREKSERHTPEAIKFHLFLAVFAIYLSKVSGKSVFHIGIPLHNRRGKDLKDVMGLLMRVVPLRVEVLPDDTVSTLITKIKRGTIKAIQHGQHLINNNHKDPVYDVLLNFHTWKGAAFHTQPLNVDWIHPMQAYESLALNVHDMEREFEGSTANIQIDFDFHQEVFDAKLQQQVLEHFCQLFATCIKNLDQSVGALSLLSPRERAMIVEQWNDTDMPLPKTCIHHLIEEQAIKTPAAAAVRFEGREVSYRELNERANQLAHYLRTRGVGRDVLVGICMERSVEMVIGLLGIVKAGGAYVPVDPTYPRERIAFMLDDSGVSLLLVQEKLLDQLPEHNAQTLCLDAEWGLIGKQDLDNPPREVHADDLAYMIYTSGSTGKPKGAMNTHVAILNRLLWMQKEYHIDASDRILQKTPFSFDVSVWEFFWPLMFGATLVVARPEGHKDSSYLRDLIHAEGITTLHFVPSMLQIFLEEDRIESLTSLKRVICSGEALSTEVQRRFFNRLKAGLHNLYGPTEAAIDVTYWACQPEDHRHTVPIGKPVANTQIYILDQELHPVPVGVPGELHIGGIQLARGYHRRAELTQEKFVPDPFRMEEGARLYKTGDLACFMPDGNVEFLGRIDHQVKIRGFRIELGEIETALLRYPGVKECVVIARKDAGGNASLAAYLVVEGTQPSVQDIRSFLLNNLPDYMVPALMMFLDRMPLSPNGKLDRKALPEPQGMRSSLQKDYVAPRTPLEEQLAQIFADLLGLDKVGIHDNFFDLGGHSLQAIRLISRIRAELHVELPLRIFFESSNIADLGVHVEQARERQSQRPLLELTPVPRDGKLPLAFTQKRLWILDQLEPRSSAYNMPTAIRIKGPFRAKLFERIFNTIIARHEVLRTTFGAENGQPYLVITPQVEILLTVHDLLDWPRDERMAEAWRLATAEAARPFDLTQGPLVRAQALRIEEDEHILLFTTHHIISDGWSIAVFVDEIQQLYNAFSSNLPSPLPALPIQFADYAYWQNEWFKGEALQTQLEYWKNKMEGAPALLELPTDRVRPALEGHAGRNIDFEFDADLTRDLKALAQQKGATLFMVLHAVFLMLLSKYSRQEDIVLGTPTANRNFYEVEPLIGFFVNTLLLRVDLSGDPTFDELLSRVKQTDIEAFDQQQVPFEHLLETLKPERSLSYSPWFQVLFVLQNTPPWDSRQIKDLEFSDFGYETSSAKFDISMDMREEGDRLTGLVQYKTDLFDETTIARMIAQFGRLLKDVAGQPTLRLSQYALTSDAERLMLLTEWNQTRLDYPREKCIHQLFEEQVKRTPQAVALIHEDRQLTYDQLNRRANVLAHFLRHKGVKPNSFVGVFLERSVDMIVSLLGILKAGGAYVPLDPKYPTDRLEYMIDDTGLDIILSSQKVFDERSLLLHERVETICLDTDWETIEQEFDDRAQQPPNGYPLNSRNLAYVIYTSGSTGQPKGVLIEHRSLVNYTWWVRKEYEITAEDRVLQFASISFDAAGEEIYGTLTTGAALVLRTDEMISSGRSFFELCARWGITALELPTAYWHQLMADLMRDMDIQIPEKLRLVVIGGEKALPEKVRQWHQRTGSWPKLINGYGPTETTIASTAKHLPVPDDGKVALSEVPIGRPVANTQTYILDAHLNPVPIGIPGELYIGGDGLARGYLNADELTAEKFVEVALGGHPMTRLYRTGDLCRYLPNGDIEYRGRIDDQVKIRGFRIELGEIESALSAHPAVEECAVLVKDDPSGQPQLAGYVSTPDDNLQATELRQFLKERLPAYMIPAGFLCLHSLPMTGAGKVNRQALKRMDIEHDSGAAYVPPRNKAEQQLAEMWQSVLGIDKVGVDDNFFDLGGHSLIATQLVSRILNHFGVRMPLLQLFQAPTVAAMSEYIQTQQVEGGDSASPALVVQDRPEHIPVTYGQRRLWQIEKDSPGLPTYNMPAAFHIKGPFNLQVLDQVIAEMTRRHETLRTTFAVVSGRPVQVIAPQVHGVVRHVDLRSLPQRKRLRQAEILAGEEQDTPFDLEEGPLLRVCVFQVSDQEFFLTVVMHHIISDGWSVDIIMRELAVLYENFANQRPSILPELPIQYADFSIWQSDWLKSEDYQRQIGYWREHLTGAPELLALKTDHPRPAVRTYEGATEEGTLDKALVGQLYQFCQKQGVTLYMVLLTGLSIVMRRRSGQEDMVIGSSIANRNRQEVEDLIGLLTNNLCLRVNLSGEPTFAELLQRVSKVCLEGYAHQDVPVEIVIDELVIEKRKDYHPVYQVISVLQNASANTGWTLPEQQLEITALPHKSTKAKYDLNIGMEEIDGQIEIGWNYSTDLFEPATIKQMLREFQMVLRAGTVNPDRPIDELGISPEPFKNTDEVSPAVDVKNSAEHAVPLVSGPRPTPLVTIQSGHASENPPHCQKPLFCVHPVGGNVFCYMDMARKLGAGQAVYGFQSPGLEDDTPPLTTIEKMAAQYVDAVAGVHQGGPVHLLGWSFGGVVAYEMARQLSGKGYPVGTLTLIDSFIPLQHQYPVFKKSTDESTLMGYLVDHLEGMFGKPLRVSQSQLQKLDPEQRLRYVLKCAIAAEVLPASFQLDQMQHFYNVYKANHFAFCRYSPQPYQGDITLFFPQKQLFVLSRANTQAWKKLVRGAVNVFPIPGDHYTMMQGESCALIARRVKDNIEEHNRNVLPEDHA